MTMESVFILFVCLVSFLQVNSYSYSELIRLCSNSQMCVDLFISSNQPWANLWLAYQVLRGRVPGTLFNHRLGKPQSTKSAFFYLTLISIGYFHNYGLCGLRPNAPQERLCEGLEAIGAFGLLYLQA